MGYTSKQIAEMECVSEATINSREDNMRKEIEKKYGISLKSSIELILWAVKNKIVEI
ncbi:MAG: hypothetical protein PHD97_04405 [Bacteroidales bacterium]|nr:hypothetical protein [Bacteroidales bacterium]